MLSQWPPYALFPSEPECGRKSPEIVKLTLTDGQTDWVQAIVMGEFDIEQTWPLDVVLKNFLVPIAAMLCHAKELKTIKDSDLTSWINLTRALARGIPYGGPVQAEMRAAADRLEQVRASFTRHLRPSFKIRGTKHEVAVRLNSLIYSLDRLLRIVKDREVSWANARAAESGRSATYITFDTAGAWEGWLGPLGASPLTVNDDAIRRRLTDFRKNIEPGHEDALLRDVLSDLLTFGSFLPDGSVRHPRTVSPQ